MRTLSLTVILAITIILITGCEKKNQTGQTQNGFFKRGVKAYHRGEYEQAANFFEKAIIFEPDNAAPYLAAAEIYDDYLNNHARAAECYIRYIALSENIELRNLAMSSLKAALAEQDTDTNADTATVDETSILRQEFQQLTTEKQNINLKLVNAQQENAHLSEKVQQLNQHAKLNRIGRIGLYASGAVIILVPLFILYLLPIIKRTRPSQTPKKEHEDITHNIFGRYHMIEDGAKTGDVSFERAPDNTITVTRFDDQNQIYASGTGYIKHNSLDVCLKNDQDYEAQTRFDFHDHGITFTAAWRDKTSTGIAAGIKENVYHPTPDQPDTAES